MRILETWHDEKEEASYIILGVAVIEDIIIISMLAILQSIYSTRRKYLAGPTVSIGTVLAFIWWSISVGSKINTKIC